MELPQIKKRVYAMRNGITADVLRRSGAPYRMIFGVGIPHLAEIAREIGQSRSAAELLWADSGVRESLLLACMVCPPDSMDAPTARRWIAEAPTEEVVDLFCMKVLRPRPDLPELVDDFAADTSDRLRYAALRMCFSLLPAHSAKVLAIARAELARGCDVTARVAAQLVDEVEFLSDNHA